MSPQPLPWVGKQYVAVVGGRKPGPGGQRKLYIHMHAQSIVGEAGPAFALDGCRVGGSKLSLAFQKQW